MMPRTLSRRSPVIADRRVGILVSIAIFAVWVWFTWAQFDRAGDKPPWFMRWATVT